MAVHVVFSVALVLLHGAQSEVCEVGSEEASILQIARTVAGNAASADTQNRTMDIVSDADDVILDSSKDALEKSLKIASDLAAALHLPKTTGLIMPRVHEQGAGSGQIVDSAKLDHESSVIKELLTTADHDVDTMKLSEELATTLGICDGDASGRRDHEFWSQIMCSIRCSSVSAVAGVACGMSDDCSAPVEEAIKVCAGCPSQICASPWLRSSVSGTDMCKLTQDASMLAVSSAAADHATDQSEWEAEKDVLKKLYHSPTMNPLSRSVLLEEQVAEMLLTCQEGADHTQAVSLAQGDAGVGFWWWVKKAACAAGCTAAGMAIVPACAATGPGCAVPVMAAIGACGSCPDIFCGVPHINLKLRLACHVAPDLFKPACQFCSKWLWGR